MTRIGYDKPLVFQTPSRPSTRPPNVGFRFRSLSSYKLRPASRFKARFYRLDSASPLVFFPHSAKAARRDRRTSRFTCSPPTGFLNLLTRRRPQQRAGLFHPASTPRVTGLQSLPPDRSSTRFPPTYFFAVTLPCMVSFRRIWVFHNQATRVFPLATTFSDSPSSPFGNRLHRGLWSALKF